MLTGLPTDPVMLLSVVNTKLRNNYKTLDILCGDLCVSKESLVGQLQTINYEYDAEKNQFV